MSETTHVQVEPDVRICVERWPASAPGAPVVLALHGFGSNRLAFAGLARAFDGAVEVVSLDHRGRAGSSQPEDPSRFGMRRHADDAAAVLRALGLRDVVVVGTSMGAWIGTQLAAHHADLVRSLVLVDGGHMSLLPAGTDPVEFVDLVLLGGIQRADLVLPPLDVVLGALSGAPGLGDLWDDDLEASMRISFEPVDGGCRAVMRQATAMADAASYNDPIEAPYLHRDVATLTMPVHLITAPQGLPMDATTCSPPIMPAQAIAELQALLPQLTVEEVPGSNHLSICLGPTSNRYVVPAVLSAVAAG